MQVAVTSEQVAAYLPWVERIARRYVGIARAEFDDLVQEGLIAVWQSFARGLKPGHTVVDGRMVDWVRYCRRLDNNDAVAYELMLPMESYDLQE